MWQAGYRMPKQPPELEQVWTPPLPLRKLEDLTEEQIREVLDYSDFVKERDRRRGAASS
jgi:hypothetical protein